MKNEIQHIYPANSLQQGFIYHALSQGEDDAYRVQILFDYHEALDAPLYIKSWECCIAQYPALRTAFNWEEDLIQLIYRRGKLNYQLHDISHLVSQQERDAAIEVIQLEDRKQGFDLAQPTLFRLHIIKQSPVYYTVLKTEHHSIADGWSGPVLLSSLHHYYQELKNNKEVNIKEETAYLRTQEYIHKYKNTAQGYWEERLSGVDGANDIAALLSKSTDISNYKQVEKPTKSTFEIKGEFYKQLKAFTSKEGITTNVVVQFIWHKLLQVYSSSLKSIVGTTISGRDLPIDGIEESVGLYINTLPLIIDWENDNAILDQLHQIQRKITEINTHSFVDLVKLQTEGERIFQSLFVYENYPAPKEGSDGLEISFRNAIEKTDYPLNVMAYEQTNSLVIDLQYDNNYLTEDRAKNHLTTLGNILHQVLANPGKSHNQISLIGKEEYDQIIYEWNNTDKDYPSDKTMYELFQAQAAKTPDNVALVCEGQELSYRELNEKSNQLARYIRAQYKVRTNKTLGPDTLIALCLERSLEMVVGILGVLKAGGAYVPMDPSYPQERLDYILDDTKAELVLSQRQLLVASETKLRQEKILYIDLAEELYKKEDVSNLSIYSKSTDLAYVIYTSGTTGKPKGVMVGHKAFVQFIYNFNNELEGKINLIQKDVLSLTNYVFDIFGLEYALPLMVGSKIILSTINEVKEKDISSCQIIQQTPGTLFHLVDKFPGRLSGIVCLVGGEALPPSVAEKLVTSFHKVINVYGSAETVIWSSSCEIKDSNKPYIGTPLLNEKMYVLDMNRAPVPIGVIGELYIGGAGLARGYLNRAELTSERFIKNPFATDTDKQKGYDRLYKTGDLVRWLPDGNIEYIGRNDDQVKIRGYRIELGEIESALSQIGGIKQSCVLVKEKQTDTGINKYLVGYYVLDNDSGALDQTLIQEKLSQSLPEYMIPSALVMMESFPLTINGKLDKKALPDPEFSSEDNYVAPNTEIEKTICGIWKELLGINKVGTTDNFFRLGGNSILAIQVSHSISKLLGCEVKVADIFKHKTISQLVIHATGQSQIIIPKVDSSQSALSFAQERLWFIEQYEGGTNAYHIPIIYELGVDTDKEGVKYALQQIVSRHEILRSTIEQSDVQGHGVQIVHEDLLFIEEMVLDSTNDYDRILEEEINRPFKLSKEYPIRIKFYNIRSSSDNTLNKTILLINTHHITSDGWSAEIFQKELLTYYEAYINNDKSFSLAPLEIQYKDYSLWQRSYLTGETLDKQLSYWKNKLSGYQTLEFPTDYARPSKIDYRGASQSFSIGREVSQKLRALAQKNGVSLNSLMLAAFNVLLGKYTGQQDIVVGSPSANRHHRQTEALIGFFVNTQVNRTQLSNTQSFEELIREVHQEQIEVQSHQDLPFEKLVDQLKVERDTSRHPIFQIIFEVTQGIGKQNEIIEQEIKYFKPYQGEASYEIERFNLSIFIDNSQEELLGRVGYAKSLYRRETIERLMRHYNHLLDQLTEAPSKPYSQISLLNDKEYDQIIYEWNNTDKDYPSDKTIVDLFENQVSKNPENVAIVFEGKEITYRQLNEQSDKLANYLRANCNVRANDLVGLMLGRSENMLIAIMGILKAGGAYVCIDPEYPEARKQHIIEDTNINMLITQVDYLFNLEFYTGKLFAIDLELDSIDNSATFLKAQIKPNHLAYVIYTSGTTGKPKGVMVDHHSVINYVNNVNEIFSPEIMNVDFSTNPVFDLTVTTTICSLLLGKKIIVFSGSLNDTDSYVQHLVNNKIDFIKSTPSLLSNLPLDRFTDYKIKQAFIGGEKLEESQLVRISKYVDHSIDEYGPTEATVGTTYMKKSIGNVKGIGKPYFNYKVYILDMNRAPVPIGVIGELYIGGAGLARGYLNRAELTSERFIKNPFATDTDKQKGYDRLYKTGDLVRWLPDGNIEYIGRNDDQVKIRGYRIELGEIESALSQIGGIKQSCVLVKEKQTDTGINKYLVGYYVLDNDSGALDQTLIQEKLSQSLPEYMIPSALVMMESFPLTINGKLDKKALPDPEFSSEDNYVAPNTEIEKTICGIWQNVLGLEKIGVTDDFFRIGGDSILSMQVSSRIRQSGFACQVKDVFEYKTISRLAEHLSKKNSEINIKAEQDILTGELDLLPIQQWFLEKVENEELAAPNHWNQSFLIRVPSLDIKKLESVIEQLVSYHDVLRIRYTKEHDIKTEKNNWKQVYQSNIFVPDLKTLDVSAHTEDEVQEILTVWQSGFDLEEGSLFQVGYLYGYKDGSARIYFALHHMIVDGVSWRILTEDIRAIYEGKKLSPKGSSYRQWVASVKKYTEEHSLESVYWENQLKGMPNYHLTVRHQEPSIGSFELNKIVTKSLLQEASKAYHTEVNDLLLTALAYALKEINHQDIQGITLEGHGREDIDLAIDHSRTVGWFTTLFPVRLEIKNNFKESIQFIKEKLRTIPNKGIGFGAFATSKEINYTYKDLVPISFNYLGQFDTQQGDWQIISENSGDNMRLGNTDNNIININGHVSNGKLGFSIVTKLGETTTKILSDSLKLQLIKIVEHCIETIEREESRYTPSDFNSVKISQSLLDQLEASAKQIQNKIQHIYPANSLQQGFIYHALSQGEDDAYRVQILFDYHEALDAPLYIKSWECCIAQYPALRTAFNWEEDLIQLIYRRGKLNYQLHDISHLVSQQERDAAIEVIQLEDRKQGFDLAQPTLFRLHIIKQSPVYYTVLKTEHHSIADGWSGPVLLSSLHHYYQELKNNKEVNIKEETAYLRTQEYIHKYKNTAQGYWEERLSGVDGANDIAALLSKSTDISNYKQVEKPTKSTFEIKGEFYKQLKAFTSKEGITTNVVVQFIWHKLLQVYSSSLKSIVGTTISGRDLPIDGIEESVGLYINTLPLIIDWENDNAILDQLHQIQRKITEINTHSFVDLVKLQTEGERIFQSLFVYENYPAPKEGSDGLEISFRNAIEKTDYPLNVMAYEQTNSLVIDLQYDNNYLTEDRAKNHLTTLGNILHQVLANPGKSHNQISLIGKEEYDQIIYEWNNTDKDYPSDKTMYELFQAQAAKTPDNVALVCEGQELSYRELNEKSNQLARYIRAQYKVRTNKTLGPDTLIALCLERSLEMVVGILGVLKAGGAYVPMDPSYPQERLDYILDDTKAELVLSQRQLLVASETKLRQEKILYIDLAEELYKKEDVSNLSIYSKSTDLAYVIYTSGTTGKPKGVMVDHHSVINYVNNVNEIFSPEIMNVDFSTNPVFDLTVTTTICSLLLGKKIIVFSGSLNDTDSYVQHLVNNKIDFIKSTPSLLSNLPLDRFTDYKIKQAFIGGEKLEESQLVRISKYVDHSIDEYGPTEATVGTTYMKKSIGNVKGIGKPYFNYKVYILDMNRAPVPIGVIGELYIGGAGLARGYLNRAELTSERFIKNPFATDTDKQKGYDRLYKTGDLVRWLPDGNIEYIGRNDDQVKIRGYRIELGEIESALSQIGGIKQSCVLVKEKQTDTGINKYLVGYYVLDNDSGALDQTLIQEKLSQSLPEYMIPSALVMMESFPLTINGKLDKKALPDPEFSSEDNYVAPNTEIEKTICGIWQNVLGLEKIGVTDDFFKLGGNSILAIQVSHSMSKVLGYNVKVAELFKYKTVCKLLENANIKKINDRNVDFELSIA